MRLPRIFRTTAFAMSVAYALVFIGSSAILLSFVYRQVEHRSREQLEDAVKAESKSLEADARAAGIPGLAAQLTRWADEGRDRPTAHLLIAADGQRLAGDLRPTTPQSPTRGWVHLVHVEDDGDEEPMLGRWRTLDGGAELLVAAETEEHDKLIASLLRAFAGAGLLGLALAVAGGSFTSAAFLRRIEGFDRTAARIMEGALDERVPTSGSGDELDRLAQRLNAMLDRIQALVESLRQVSSDVAHDLRTPLTRLRQGLESAQRDASSAADMREAVDRALEACDQILATFGALLRIAQIEAGTRRAGFTDVDLTQLCETIAETYGPVAEDAQHPLSAQLAPGVHLRGDPDLLTQALANLVENALHHTPAGTAVHLRLRGDAASGWVVEVADEGPGIADADRARVRGRFVRLDSSRSTPGNGLGLSLVEAVAELHGLALGLDDARPGLSVTLRPATKTGA